MADIFALDVSMGKSYCVWYRGKHCLKEFSLVHTKAGFNALRDMIKKAQKPIIYFEATGIYSRVIEHFCETNGLRFCRLNPLELHLKSERVYDELRPIRKTLIGLRSLSRKMLFD